MKFRHGSFFSGFGGFDVAAEWMGWENMFHCEINPFCSHLLKYYWPNAISYDDITKTNFAHWRDRIDIVSGGFPCQPFSAAGKREGTDDARHLWPEYFRAIREIAPRWVVGENVYGLVNWSGGLVLDQVCADLESEGYEVLPPYVLPVAAKNGPHRRDRVWIIAYRSGAGSQKRKQSYGRTDTKENRSGLDGRSKRSGSFGNAADTYRDRTAPEARTDRETKSGRAADHVARPGEQIATNRGTRRAGLCRDATDADLSGRGQGDEKATAGPSEQFNGDSLFHTTDTDGHGLQRGRESFGPPPPGRQTFERITSPEQIPWYDFPTEPPICGGNDGIPPIVDVRAISDMLEKGFEGRQCVSFATWRKESIKGYGNAVAPIIPFELFKIIEEIEKNHL